MADVIYRLSWTARCALLSDSLYCIMNVFVESKPNCIATLRVELEPERVEKEWQAVSKAFQKQARIPGFRPGKAPQALIEKKFESDIREELQNKLLRSAMNEAIEEKKLRVISVSNVDKVEILPDRSMHFTATLVMSPEFEMPDYSTIEIEAARRPVGDDDVENALKTISEQHAEFETIDSRALEMEDFAVLTYEAKLDDVPLIVSMPDAPKLLAGKPNWWIRVSPGTLAPGFSEALTGLAIDETRSFELTLPEDFSHEALRGKSLLFTATLHEIRSRKLPELNDDFASRVEPGKTMQQLRDEIRSEMEKYADRDFETTKRNGAIQHLLTNVTCDLPTHLVNNEMQDILKEIVQENQVRGISDDELKSQEDQILGFAKQSAADRVRSRFLLLRIAEHEALEVTQEEMTTYIIQMSARYEMPVQKLIKDLQRRNAFGTIREQILVGKTLEFIASNVTVKAPVEAVAPAA